MTDSFKFVYFFFAKNNFPFTFLRYSFPQLFASRPTISLVKNRPAGNCFGHFWQKIIDTI